MDLLKAEIERKRKQAQELTGGRKYFKRAELISKHEEEYLKRHGLQKIVVDESKVSQWGLQVTFVVVGIKLLIILF
jgi:hypothetical protein